MVVVEMSHGGSVCTIRLNRPSSLNSLSKRLVADLAEAFRAVSANKAVKAVILTVRETPPQTSLAGAGTGRPPFAWCVRTCSLEGPFVFGFLLLSSSWTDCATACCPPRLILRVSFLRGVTQ